MDAAGNRHQDEVGEDIPPPVENNIARGQPQDPRYDNMAYYNMAYDYPPPHGHPDYGVVDYAGVAQDDPTDVQGNSQAHVCSVLSFPYTNI